MNKKEELNGKEFYSRSFGMDILISGNTVHCDDGGFDVVDDDLDILYKEYIRHLALEAEANGASCLAYDYTEELETL